MTLTGKRNHYNVKFLKGYGFSVHVKNSKIVLKNNYDPFSEPEIEEHYPKNMPYEKIVVQNLADFCINKRNSFEVFS